MWFVIYVFKKKMNIIISLFFFPHFLFESVEFLFQIVSIMFVLFSYLSYIKCQFECSFSYFYFNAFIIYLIFHHFVRHLISVPKIQTIFGAFYEKMKKMKKMRQKKF